MIPVYSSEPVVSAYVGRVGKLAYPLEDYERGGPTIGVPSSSAEYEWRAFVEDDTVYVEREGVAPEAVLSATNLVHVSLAFDTSMRPHIAYHRGSTDSYFYHWDTLANQFVTMTLPNARVPRVCSDIKDPVYSNDRDIILAYTRGTNLYARVQRERYDVEHVGPAVPADSRLMSFGMSRNNRLQWRLTP